VSPNHSYTYQLVAKDAAGNASGFSNSATVQTGDIFADDFETGGLSRWTTVSGLVASQQQVDTGSWAARATSDGTTGASAQVTFDSGVDDGYYRLRFDRISQGPGTVDLMRVRNASNGALVTVFVTATGKLGYRNDQTGVSTTTTTSVPTGLWHELQLHVTDGDTGLVELWLDGVRATSQPEALGTNPVRRFEIGETSATQPFDIAYDNVIVSPSLITDTQRPTAPGNLQVTGETASSVSLTWDPATDDVGVTGYRVYRDGAGVADLDGSTGSYTDTSVTDSHQYTYRVTALDAAGHESPASNSVSVTTDDATKPTPPTSVTASASGGNVQVSWSGATDNTAVTGYRVYRDDVTQPLATVTTGTTYTDTTVRSSTSYTYRVTALDAAGNESDRSAPATVVSADTDPPTAPGSVQAAPAGDTSVTVTWAAASDAVGVTGYDVYRNGGATPVGSVNGATRSFTDAGLAADTTYSYTVKARDAAGNVSTASAPASATTWVFADGFETGNFSRWSSFTGIVTSTAEKFSGTYGAVASVQKGNVAAFAAKVLPGTYADLTYDIRFKLLTGKTTNIDFLRFRTASGANILSLYYSDKKMLAYQNDVRGTSTVSTSALPVGVWQEAKVRVQISGSTSRVSVWLNGTAVPALTKVDNLGSNPVGQVVAGESTTGRAFDFAVDDVRVTQAP
jgi:fibronectin type 3 domain-containing protein